VAVDARCVERANPQDPPELLPRDDHGDDGLVRYDVNFFVLEKFARVVKTPNLVVYVRMRGEAFEEFMQTRRVPSMR